MEKHDHFTDIEFEKQFRHGLLHPDYFSHQAHLRLAWIHINNYGIDAAILNITAQIKNFTKIHGAEDKYNETVTIAAIRAVYHFWLKSESDNFKNFIAEFPRLQYNFRELLGYHYAFDIFISEEAKTHYLEPDLLPFD
ncbi:MAG: hypothetical protein AAFP76_14975 [Bacteroidota bacterium]